MLWTPGVAWAPNEGGGGGGCHVGCYYVGGLSSTNPVNACGAFPGSQGLACTGWNYWDRSRVYKATGGWIRVGFWNPDLTMHYYQVSGIWVDPNPIVVLRTDGGMSNGAANSYNSTTCAYDYTYGGASSSVECDALLFT